MKKDAHYSASLFNRFAQHAALLLAALCTAQASADNYVIQVGAYRNLNAETLELARSLGQTQQIERNGITRLQVGSYESRESAEASLTEIQNAGFADAFVTAATNNGTQVEVAASSEQLGHSHGGEYHVHLPSDMQRKLDALSREDRNNVVILNGKLHRKVGDEFIPL